MPCRRCGAARRLAELASCLRGCAEGANRLGTSTPSAPRPSPLVSVAPCRWFRLITNWRAADQTTRRSDCCHCGALTATVQSRAQSLAGAAPSSIRKQAREQLPRRYAELSASDRAHVPLRGGCNAAFSALSTALMDAAREIGWLPRSLKMRHRTRCRVEAANAQCAMGVSLSAPEPEPAMALTRPLMARDNP
jgi:hypothetical protein